MKIIITGICGFVGAALTRELRSRMAGVELFGVDNLIRPGAHLNRQELLGRGVRVWHGDVRMASDWETLPAADWLVDAAANPSVLAGVDGQTSSRQLLEHNLGGTLNALEYCKRHRCGLVLLSTSRVYSVSALAALPIREKDGAFELDARRSREQGAGSGECGAGEPALTPGPSPERRGEAGGSGERGNQPSPPAPLPKGEGRRRGAGSQEQGAGSREQGVRGPLPAGVSAAGLSEDFSIAPPLSLYGSSKLCSEWLALEYGAAFGFPVWINRCGVLAGAGQFGKVDQGIFSYWIHSWHARRPLRYIGFGGRGFQVRDALHPRDLAALVVEQMRRPEGKGDRSNLCAAPSGPFRQIGPVPFSSRVFNLGGGASNSMSLAQLSGWCAGRFGPHEVARDPAPRPYDIPWVVMDSARAHDAWGWSPSVSLQAILEEIACHAEANPKWCEVTA